MEKEFIPYTEALALKELGFDEPCLSVYTIVEKLRVPTKFSIVNNILNGEYNDDFIPVIKCVAPTWQQAFRWFREKYHIIGEVKFKGGKTTKTAWYDYIIYSEIDWDDKNPNEQWKKYEEAELACLEKLIEIVENQK
jgi:hypothetical protein